MEGVKITLQSQWIVYQRTLTSVLQHWDAFDSYDMP